MIEYIFRLISCHFVGDYVLQNDFLAKTKGTNIWHMLAHCVLYSLPFAFIFGIDWRVWLIIGTHIVIDLSKARWHKINYVTDQVLHLVVLMIYFI